MARPGRGLGPDERRPWIGVLKRGPMVSDLADQNALRREMPRRFAQDAVYQREPVDPPGQRAAGFVPILGRQAPHTRQLDVRRIADDEVVAPPPEAGEEVAVNDADAALHRMQYDIAPRNRQRRTRVVTGVDSCARKRMRCQDRQTTGAGAQVERASNRMAQPRNESRAQQFRDERAWHDHAPVHIKAVLTEPGFMYEIGDGYAGANAPLDKCLQALCLGRAQTGVRLLCQLLWRKTEHVKD